MQCSATQRIAAQRNAVKCNTVQRSATGFFASRERFSVNIVAYVVGGRLGMGVTHYIVR